MLLNPQLESKVVVGASGVLLVLVAVFASMGMYGWAGVEATLFCIEVGLRTACSTYLVAFSSIDVGLLTACITELVVFSSIEVGLLTARIH